MRKYKKIIIDYSKYDKSILLRIFRHNINIKRTAYLFPFETKCVKFRFLYFSIIYTKLCDISLKELKAKGIW